MKYFTDPSKAVLLLWSFFLSCVRYAFARICTLWSPAGKGVTSWLSFIVSNCDFVTFPIGILGQVWYLTLSIPNICPPYLFRPIDPPPRPGSGGGVEAGLRAKYLFPCCCIHVKFEMQHNHVLKKLIFLSFDSNPRVVGEGVCR